METELLTECEKVWQEIQNYFQGLIKQEEMEQNGRMEKLYQQAH